MRYREKNEKKSGGVIFMVLTFPDIGCAGLIAGVLFRDLGIAFIPTPSAEGAEESEAFRDAPEDMCLPFKLFASELERAWQLGADTVVMPSSRGPCRLGEFCELLKVLLDRRGCRYDWIVLDVPSDIGVRELLRRASLILPDEWKERKNRRKLLRKIHHTRHLLKQLESFESDIRRNAGYYENPKEAVRLIASCKKELSQAENLEKAFEIMGRFRWKKTQLRADFARNPVRVALTGEIFTLNEPYANRRVEDRLAELGVCVERDITIGWWIRKTATDPLRGIFRSAQRGKSSIGKRYLNYEIGGYTKDSVEYAASSRLRGFDGVIQIFPAGCMPEIVGRAVLNRVAEEQNIRIMTLIYDEMSGEAGYLTRIEAFTDMLERRKSSAV